MPGRGAPHRAGARQLPDARWPARQRRRPRHAGQRRSACCARCARPAIGSTTCRPMARAWSRPLLAGVTNALDGRRRTARSEPALRLKTISTSSTNCLMRLDEKSARRWGEPAADPHVVGRRFRARRAAARQCRGRHPAGARLSHRPRRQLPRSRPAAAARLSRLLCLAAPELRRACRDPPRQARQSRMAARQGAGAVGGLLPGGGARPPAPRLPVHRQRSGRRQPGQAARGGGDRRPSDAAA